MILSIVTFIKLCLICLVIKTELNCADKLGITVPEIKEAYAWTQTPHVLFREMDDCRCEAIRLVKLVHERMLSAKNLAEYTNEKGLQDTIIKLENIEDEANQTYAFIDLCFRLKSGAMRSCKMIKSGERSILETNDQLATDTRLVLDANTLLHEVTSYITESTAKKLPLSVQKLFKNTLDLPLHKEVSGMKYLEAVFNTFI
jgi:hypothetical protein